MTDIENKKATLKTIADITGLSLSTVSLSLRGGSNLKQETRDKVAAAARQVGYVPNRAGVRLRTGRTNVIALALAADENVLDFTRLLIQGIGAQIDGTRYHLNVVPEFQRRDTVEAVRYILDNRSADGVILTHTSANDPRVKHLMTADFPFVSHGRTEFVTPHAYHDFHAEQFLEMSVERLIQKGRRNIILAAVNNGTKNYETMVDGFKAALNSAGLQGQVGHSSERLNSAQGARAFAHKLASRKEEWDGIICNNELTALSIVGGLQDKGITFATDYDLICKQNTEILPTLYPKIDTVAEDLFSTGKELAKLLMARIEGTAPRELQTLQQPEARWRS